MAGLFIWLDDRSRMSREAHVRICEGVGVKFPRPTRLCQQLNSIINTTTMMDTIQKAEIFNTTISNLRKNLSEYDLSFLQDM